MKKYKVALFIGRFQPFHKGHLFALKKSLELADKVIIGIGSSNVSDENNPWSYEERRKMVEAVVEDEGLKEELQAIWAVPDDPSDEVWGRYIVDSLGEEGLQVGEVVAVGNNDWTNKVLRDMGMKVVETGLYNRNELEGVKIREMIFRQAQDKLGDESWRERVPEVVSKLINNLISTESA